MNRKQQLEHLEVQILELIDIRNWMRKDVDPSLPVWDIKEIKE